MTHRPDHHFWTARNGVPASLFSITPAAWLDPEVWVGDSEYVVEEEPPNGGWAHRPGCICDPAADDVAARLLEYAVERYARRHPEQVERLAYAFTLDRRPLW